MSEIVRHVPGVACRCSVREACARLHDQPGVLSVEVGETWTELVVRVDPDLLSTDLVDMADFPLADDDR